MAMEAVCFSQDPLGYYTERELYSLLGVTGGGGGNYSFDLQDTGFGLFDNHHDQQPLMLDYPSPLLQQHWTDDNNVLDVPASLQIMDDAPAEEVTVGDRPKRRRVKSRKNKEDIETQRMTHIAVERNRRKQMNEYLAVLRSLMPESYVQRSDQASIIGGAINFVKELEQQLHLLDATKHTTHHHLPRTSVSATSSSSSQSAPLPFSEFFTFPQYSTTSCSDSTAASHHCSSLMVAAVQTQSNSVADVEVTMVERHANMKIRSRKGPKQLLRVVSGLQDLRLTVLHLNVSTVDNIVLYSISVKVEDDCKLTSVDEIASAVYEILPKIQEQLMPTNIN